MFEKFGEFNSYEELNMAAAGQLEQGDLEALKALAQENGIDAKDAEDYREGILTELATEFSAAYGRLTLWKKDAEGEKDRRTKHDLMVVHMMLATVMSDDGVAAGMMKKGRNIRDFLRRMKNLGCFCGTDEELRQLLKAYFTETESLEELAEKIKKRYE